MRCKHVLDTCNCNTCEQRHDTRGCRRDGISGNTFTILPSRQGNLPCNFLQVLRQLCQLPGQDSRKRSTKWLKCVARLRLRQLLECVADAASMQGKCPAACFGHLQLQHLRDDTRPVRARDRISGTHSNALQMHEFLVSGALAALSL